jgi:hypothetical protein
VGNEPGGRGGSVPVTPAELANLWVEEPDAPFHIALVGTFEAVGFQRADGGVDLAAVRTELASRAHRVPALRRRLTTDRRPAWCEDAQFEVDRHIDCAELPPGTDFLDWCSARILQPLDRSRPLWRADLVGLPGNRWGLLLVVHHALADGQHGVAMLRALLDGTEAPSPAPERAAAPPPAAAEPGYRRHPLVDALTDLRTRAPVTSLFARGATGPVRRRLSVVSASLGEVRSGAHAAGATVNDVLLAAVTAGLRDLLIARGDEVAGLVLRASMPMASGGTAQPGGLLLVGLPVGEPDPARRLAAIVSTTSAMKSRRRSGGGSVFDVLRLPLPLARASVRWMRHLAGRRINLFVTDVPGPTSPLFLGPARLLSAVPVAPLVRTVPLGVAALSYAGTLVVSVNADDTLGNLTPLTRGIQRSLDDLIATAS